MKIKTLSKHKFLINAHPGLLQMSRKLSMSMFQVNRFAPGKFQTGKRFRNGAPGAFGTSKSTGIWITSCEQANQIAQEKRNAKAARKSIASA